MATFNFRLYNSPHGGGNVNNADFTYTGAASQFLDVTVEDDDGFLQTGVFGSSSGEGHVDGDADNVIGRDTIQTVTSPGAFQGSQISFTGATIVRDANTGDVLGAAYRVQGNNPDGTTIDVPFTDNYYALNFTPDIGTDLDFEIITSGSPVADIQAAGLDPSSLPGSGTAPLNFVPEYESLSDGNQANDNPTAVVSETSYTLRLWDSAHGGGNPNPAGATIDPSVFTEITVVDQDGHFENNTGTASGSNFADLDEVNTGDNRQVITTGPAAWVGGTIHAFEMVVVFDQTIDVNNVLGVGWKIQVTDAAGDFIVAPTDNMFVFNFDPTPIPAGDLLTIRASPGGFGADIYTAAGVDPDFATAFGIGSQSLIPDWEDVGTLLCFTSGTMIETELGEVAIEDLSVGDNVRTLNNGYKAITWIGKTEKTAQELRQKPTHRPIRIRKGALGQNQPSRDLIVSPQHRMLVNSKIVKRLFGEEMVLLPAVKLLDIDGVDVVEDDKGVTYWHMLFEDHEVVIANGAYSESLYTGPEAMKALTPKARREIHEIMPQLFDIDYKAFSNWKLPHGKKVQELVRRHVKNNKPLMDEMRPLH